MNMQFFLILAFIFLLFAQKGEAIMQPQQGHRLTEEQKQWVQTNRPDSNLKDCGQYSPHCN